MKTTHQVIIPSPLGYMGEVEDKRQKGKVIYSMEMYWKLVLMGICAGKKNVPAIKQWLEDNRLNEYYYVLGKVLLLEKSVSSLI